MLMLEANVKRQGIVRETLLGSIHLDGERIGDMSMTDEFTFRGCLYRIKQRRIGTAPQFWMMSRGQREFGYVCDAAGIRTIVFHNNRVRFERQRFRLTGRWLRSEWRIVQGRDTEIATITRTTHERRTASAKIVIVADEYEPLVVSCFFCMLQSALVPSLGTVAG